MNLKKEQLMIYNFIPYKAKYSKSFFIPIGGPDNLRNIINEPWYTKME